MISKQIDAAVEAAQAQQASLVIAQQRQRRLLQAEQDLKAAQLAVEQEEAAAQQRREAADLDQSREAKIGTEQQAEADRAKTEEGRLLVLEQQRAKIEARRRDLAAATSSAAGQAPSISSAAPGSDRLQTAPPALAKFKGGQSLAEFRRAADIAGINQATRIDAITTDRRLLDAGIYYPVLWGHNQFLTLRQLLAEALANGPASEEIAVSTSWFSANGLTVTFKVPSRPQNGLVFRHEGDDLFLVGLSAGGKAIELNTAQAVTAGMLALVGATGLALENFPDLAELRPH